MKLLSLSTLLLILSIQYAIADSKLFYVGGAWKTCGSYSQNSCVEGTQFNDQYRTDTKGIFTQKIAEQILAERAFKSDIKLTKKLHQAFKKLLKNGDLSASQKELITKIKLASIKEGVDWSDLTDAQFYAISDFVTNPIQKPESVDITQTKYEGSQKIYQGFAKAVAAANQTEKSSGQTNQRPVVLISTASGYNPYDAVEFYQQVVTALGFEPFWLPIDAALMNLMDNGLPCENLNAFRANALNVFNTENRFPNLYRQQLEFCRDPKPVIDKINHANGIIFNGGDQSLTFQTFVNSKGKDRKILETIKARIKSGKMALAGTSAGTAIHSKRNMITGGTSEGALLVGAELRSIFTERNDPKQGIRPVTFAQRGSEIFPYGVTDTHFSERGRQIRLLELLSNSDSTLGFGVDEITALGIDPKNSTHADFEVVGEAGVFIAVKQGKNKWLTSYLQNGDQGVIESDSIVFKDMKGQNLIGNLTVNNDHSKNVKTIYIDNKDWLLDESYRTQINQWIEEMVSKDQTMTLKLKFELAGNHAEYDLVPSLNSQFWRSSKHGHQFHSYSNILMKRIK